MRKLLIAIGVLALLCGARASRAAEVCINFSPCSVYQLNATNATFAGTLNVTGASTLTGNVSMGGTLAVTGASSHTGAATFSSTLAGTLTQGDTTSPNQYPGLQYTVNYTPTTVGTGLVAGVYGLVNRLGSQTIANPGHVIGIWGQVVNNATGTTTDLVVGSEGKHVNTLGTITNGIGGLGVLTSNGGTYTNWYGHYSQITANAGTITNGFGYGLTVASAGTLTNFIGYDYPSISGGATIGTALAFRNNDTAANQQFFGKSGFGVAPSASAIVKIDNVATGLDPFQVYVGGVQGASVGLDGGTYGFSHVEACTSSKIPTLAESGETYSNTGAGGACTFTLTDNPGANNEYTVCVTVAQLINIAPSAGETLSSAGVSCATNLHSNTIGSCARIKAITSGSGGAWLTTYVSGTWVCS